MKVTIIKSNNQQITYHNVIIFNVSYEKNSAHEVSEVYHIVLEKEEILTKDVVSFIVVQE